jgi:NAD(P)-dependent dehydrogenase (short-subunit alcohol dehydrogenase family)
VKSASVKDYVEKTLAAYGRIDAFFNNAGIEGKIVPFQDYDEEVFDQVIAVNLKGVFLGMRHVLPVLLKQGSGTIVNTASVAGCLARREWLPMWRPSMGFLG